MFKILYSFLAIFLLSLNFMSCGSDSSSSAKPAQDSLPLVSDYFLEDGDETEDESVVFSAGDDYYEEDNSDDYSSYSEDSYSSSSSSNYSSSSSGSSGSSGGGLGNPKVMAKYQEYVRDGDQPKDFAEAIVWPVIAMTYEDEDFKSAKSRVLNANLAEGVHVIEMVITWSNKWVPKFEVQGVLTVNEDGSNARFEIISKNLDAESLEISSGNYDTVLELEQI